MPRFLAGFLVLACCASSAGAQVGVLDPEFGDAGRAVAGFGRTSFHGGDAVVLLPDDRFIVAGSAFSASAGSVTLTRFHPNGAVDSTFGDDGTALIHFDNGADATATDVVRRPDGRLLVAAYDGAIENRILAFTAGGQIDSTFGQAGHLVAPIRVRSLVLQTDGRIVAAGYSGPLSTAVLSVARFGPNGDLDLTFGEDGIVLVPFSAGNSSANALALDEQGRVVVVGRADGTTGGIAIARILANGTLDGTFGTAGIVVVPITFVEGRDVGILDDQRIVVAGSGSNGNGGAIHTLRLLPDGSRDPSYGGTGVFVVPVPGSNEDVRAVLPQADGGMIIAGDAWDGVGPQSFLLARVLGDGSLDPSFGAGGIVNVAVAPGYAAAFDASQRPDGRILAIGQIMEGIGAARYLPNGALDEAFGEDGAIRVYGVGPGFDRASRLAVRPDGRLLVGETSEGYPCYLCATVVQFDPDGRTDSTFGYRGKAVSSSPLFVGGEYLPVPIALQSDGKVVVASAGWPASVAITRFTDNGFPDPTFGTGGTSLIFLAGGQFTVVDLAVDESGALVLVGELGDNPTAVRLLSDGTLDQTWGSGGVVSIPVGIWSMVGGSLLDDGRIVLAAMRPQPTRLVLAALLPEGQLDPLFGSGGVVQEAYPNTWFNAIASQSDGRLVVVGEQTDRYAIARYTTRGARDSTFGTHGLVRITHAAGTARAAAVQPDGRIVLAGYSGSGFGILRLQEDGAPDSTFGVNGWTTTAFPEGWPASIDVALQPAGRIVAVGSTGDAFQSDLALAGYLPQSTTPTEPHSPAGPQASHELSLVRPNPIQDEASFTLFVAASQDVLVEVHDALGRRVASLFHGPLTAGETRSFTLRGGILAAGVYALRVRGESFQEVRTVTVVR
jgi:uncharacterized delta-60 repeat protein